MRSGKLFRTNCNRLRLVRRRGIFGGVGGIKLLKLPTRREIGRWVQWLLGLFGGHLPGRLRCIELLKLRPGNVFSVRRERLLKLFAGNLSIILGRV